MRPVAIACAALLLSLAELCAGPLPLAADGKAFLPVVISPKASSNTLAVACELAGYLSQISGAKFAVEKGDGTRGIVLGTLAEFPDPALAAPLQLRGAFDGREAFAIRTEPGRLLLIGATDLGASHAAYRLLEHLGCRWFFPAREWEVVPAAHKLDVLLDVTDRPKILARRIWYGYGLFADPGHPRSGSALQDYEAWARHNRMASSFRVYAGHAWQSIIAAHKQEFVAHPEYLALVKGERKGEQLCVSNPEVRRLATAWALAFFEKNPDREMVSLECSDGNGQCECENCRRLGKVSNRVFGLANDVARVVVKEYPGKMVGCLAYSEHSEPPDFDLEPNVYVQLTMGFTRGRYSFEELREMWPKRCRSMGFYDYFSVWLWDFDKLPGGRGANLTHIAENIRTFARLGATSLDAESGNNWGVHGLGYYVANRLMWNPDADVESLIADFYDRAFGPAAPAMRRYYERWAPDREPLLSRGLVGELFRDVEAASGLARQRPDVLARLDALKHYLRYVHLRWQLDHEKDKARQKELAVAILALVYRTRYEYMNHWAAVKQAFVADAAKKFDEPTWTLRDRAAKPWLIDQPVTREETAQWFAEGLDYFQPTPVREVSFDCRDLMPVNFSGSNQPVSLVQAFQRVEKYGLGSISGEPLEMELTVGTIAWYRDRPDASWTLKDANEIMISQGRQKLDGEPQKLVLKVPQAGPYFFECDDSGAGWSINLPAGRPAVWFAKRGAKHVPLGQYAERFFYVPRGTRQLQFFYSGGPCKVLDPDRRLVAEVKTSDEMVTLDVPGNADGKAWSLLPHTHSQLWLMNAPNLFAASPGAFLLPRELVQRDKIP